MTPPPIALTGLSRDFAAADGAARVLRDITLAITPGDFVAVTGRSGSGKSTLLNIIGGLDRGYSGSCRIGGLELRELDDRALAMLRRQTFGFVFQHFGLIPVLNCQDNVALPAYYEGAPSARRRKVAGEYLTRLGLSQRRLANPSTLSGGEQQRVAIARALINAAPIVIADEPTGSLDSRNAEAVFAHLESLNREGRTVVLVTHDPSLAARASRCVTFVDGRIADDRRAADRPSVPEQAAHPVIGTGLAGASAAGRFVEAAKMVARTLRERILQSTLTALGIAIGAASVIALAIIGEGAQRQVIAQIESLGSDLVTISRGPPGVRGGERLVVSLVPGDQSAVEGFAGVVGFAPEIDGVVTARFRNKDFLVTVTGTNEQFPVVRDWPIEDGLFFSADAVGRYGQVAVLGATAAGNLFGAESPVGHHILLGNSPFRILGVLERKGVTTGPGHDRDNQIWVPVTTASARLFNRQYIERIVAKLERGTDPEGVAQDIRARMLVRHGREDFSVNTLTEVIRASTRAQRTLDYLLAAIAGISLLVGGVGVMNIMLATVNERRREIGIRMAIGAAKRDILVQFLGEALLLCAAGGLGGLLLGAAGVFLTAHWTSIPVTLTTGPFLLAACSALAVGLLFGVAPALRAASTDPVAAFRQIT